MQYVRKRQDRESKSHEGTTWTTNSDLFMSIAIIFLIMFVFALLSSGATQISVQQEKADAQKYLLGKIPETEKAKTAKEMEDAAKDIKLMAEKRELLKTSLAQLAQMAAAVESREDSIQKLYARQDKNQALLQQSQTIIAKNEKDLADRNQKVKQLETSLADIQKKAATSEAELTQKNQLALKQAEEIKTLTASSKDNAALRAQLQATEKKVKDQTQLKETAAQLQKDMERARVETKELTSAKANLTQKLTAAEGSNAKLSDELAKLRQENKDLKAKNGSLASANDQMTKDLKKGQSENEGLKSQNGKLNEKVAGLEGQVKGLGAENGKLKNANGTLTGDNEGLKGQLGKLGDKYAVTEAKNKTLSTDNDQLKKDNAIKDKKFKEASETLSKLQKDKGDLDQRFAALATDHDQLKKVSTDTTQKLTKLEKTSVVCEDEKAKSQDQQKKLAALVGTQEKQLNEAASTLTETRKAVADMDNERKRIAGSIASNLKSSGVEVDVNPETGNITLRMDESFYFKNNSYELRDEAKQKIAKIMPVYAQSLLGTPKIASRIERIMVTGFASPKFNKTYVDPATVSGEPYEYNLELSLSRSREIVNYMVGNQIPAYPFKEQMRNLVSVAGMGMMGSIPLEKNSICVTDPAAGARFEECSCGTFDCKRSRRVEIQFVLRNQKDTERHLQIISGKLNEKGAKNVGH